MLRHTNQHGSGNAVCRAQPAVRQRLHKAGKTMHKTRQKRISEDCNGYSDRICHHGIHRFLRQTHPHPHQQHHCWCIRREKFERRYVVARSWTNETQRDKVQRQDTTTMMLMLESVIWLLWVGASLRGGNFFIL